MAIARDNVSRYSQGMETNNTMFRVLGTTDEVSTCDCCGRTGLKSTVALDVVETGDVVHFGVTCAAKAMHQPVKYVKEQIDAVAAAKRAAVLAKLEAESKAYSAWLVTVYGVSSACDLFGKGVAPADAIKRYRAEMAA